MKINSITVKLTFIFRTPNKRSVGKQSINEGNGSALTRCNFFTRSVTNYQQKEHSKALRDTFTHWDQNTNSFSVMFLTLPRRS